MSWNYRIIKHIDPYSKFADPYYAIHEMYYDPDGHSTKEIIIGDSVEELKQIIEMLKEAFNKPVLVYNDKTDSYE